MASLAELRKGLERNPRLSGIHRHLVHVRRQQETLQVNRAGITIAGLDDNSGFEPDGSGKQAAVRIFQRRHKYRRLRLVSQNRHQRERIDHHTQAATRSAWQALIVIPQHLTCRFSAALYHRIP